MKRLLLAIHVSMTLIIMSLTGLASTNLYTSPSYDRLPITPDDWQEVDLAYTNKIDGKSYLGEMKLLRPKTWLAEKKKHHLCPLGNPIHLSIPEFGIHDICAKVTAVKPITLDTSNIDWSKQNARPVIGTFKRYASIVNTYMFKDRHGTITKIHATPNHPFYVKNKHTFIPIEHVSSTDQLVTKMGKSVHLVCPQHKPHHCGKRYNTHGKPTPVYNLEVYQQHVYYIGNNKILVHNICNLNRFREKKYYLNNDSLRNFEKMDDYRDFVGVANTKTGEITVAPGVSRGREIGTPTVNTKSKIYQIGSNKFPTEYAIERNQYVYKLDGVDTNIAGHRKLLNIMGEQRSNDYVGFYGTFREKSKLIHLGWNSNVCNPLYCGGNRLLTQKYRDFIITAFRDAKFSTW